jgi:hypothetical protein
MRTIVKAAALAFLLCGTALAAGEKSPPAADPGEEIKQGFVKFGHGIRDGAVKAWGAVRSAVGGGEAADKGQKRPPKNAPKEAK